LKVNLNNGSKPEPAIKVREEVNKLNDE